jgi:drug/metabolite transporter (DMT)-like permease
MDRRSWLMLLALAAIWGASYMFIKIAVRDLSPAMVAWSRIALAAIVLAAFAAWLGELRGLRGKAGTLVLVGAVQIAGPFLLIAAGEEEISSSVAGILVTSTPLFTALLAIWFDHEERSQGLRLGGVVLGVIGVAVLLGVDLSGSGNELLGGIAVVLAGLGYAIAALIVKHRLSDVPPIGVAAWVMVAATALLTPAALATLPGSAPGLGPVTAVVVLGVIGTGVAFAIFYRLLARVGPAKTWVLTYLAPGFAVVYGATFLDETITVTTIAGLALILAGSWLAAEGRLPGLPVRADDDDGVDRRRGLRPGEEHAPGAEAARLRARDPRGRVAAEPRRDDAPAALAVHVDDVVHRSLDRQSDGSN